RRQLQICIGDKGYTEQQIAGIWGGNLLRVMGQAQAYAAGKRESGVGR
ncbi:membrane dipeptidase, partial [Xanthomonas perforans]